MRKLFYIILTLGLVCSCGEKNADPDTPSPNPDGETPMPPIEETLEEKLIGEWHSISLAVEADIFISFASDKTFEMYQQIEEGFHRLYRGTWSLEGTTLSGKYNDSESWAADYKISIEGNELTMTSVNESAEVSKYEECTIPSEVKDNCIPVVKSL